MPQKLNEKIYSIDFLIDGTLHEMTFDPNFNTKFAVTVGSPEVRITLSEALRSIRYTAKISIPCTLQQFEFVQALILGRYKSGPDSPLSLPHIHRGEEKIAADGSIDGFEIKHNHLPPDIQTICTHARKHLKNSVSKFISTIRWAQHIDAPHNAFNEEQALLYWRTDPTTTMFEITPSQHKEIQLNFVQGIRWNESDKCRLQELLDSGVEEPLAHEIRREAITLWPTAPRSALLALNSALEIGVKQHISMIAPKTDWLMREIPSPPIHKILKRYLPILHADRTDIKWENLGALFKKAQILAETRNSIAHTGTIPIEINFDQFNEAVQDFLYLFDFLEQKHWAADYISTTTRKQLGWPPAPHLAWRYQYSED